MHNCEEQKRFLLENKHTACGGGGEIALFQTMFLCFQSIVVKGCFHSVQC